MPRLRMLAYGLGFLAFVSLILTAVPKLLDPTEKKPEKERADRQWVSTSPYWLDRQACRWLSLCGLHHVRLDPAWYPTRKPADDNGDKDELRLELRRSVVLDSGKSETYSGRSWEDASSSASQRRPPPPAGAAAAAKEGRVLKKIPQYVLDHAPLVHLSSDEHFWPADIAEHVRHMTPHVNDEPANMSEPLSLDNMYLLNRLRGPGREVYLRSNDDVEMRPQWLYSEVGIPLPPADDDDEDVDDGAEGHGEPRQEADEEARRKVGDGTSWFDVGKSHPLHRISVPPSFSLKAKTKSRLVQKLLMDRPPDLPRTQGQTWPSGPLEERRRQRRAFGPVEEKHVRDYYKPDSRGFSRGPAVLVVIDKGNGIVDAFWFFFYAYNLGQTVLGLRYGNHVGDWEHCTVRFEDGVPRGIFFSEHEGGQAYAFGAVERHRGRPVIYSAVGSHAMYPMPGIHPYVLPFHMLMDVTDRGPVWDPAKNIYAYHYDPALEPHVVHPRDAGAEIEAFHADEDAEDDWETEPASLTPAAENPDAPTGWFHYAGCWGDRLYRLSDVRQYRLFQQYHYVEGPLGPKFKNLARMKICQNLRCRMLYSLNPGETWYG